MAELVDALVSGTSSRAGNAGSSPVLGIALTLYNVRVKAFSLSECHILIPRIEVRYICPEIIEKMQYCTSIRTTESSD